MALLIIFFGFTFVHCCHGSRTILEQLSRLLF